MVSRPIAYGDMTEVEIAQVTKVIGALAIIGGTMGDAEGDVAAAFGEAHFGHLAIARITREVFGHPAREGEGLSKKEREKHATDEVLGELIRGRGASAERNRLVIVPFSAGTQRQTQWLWEGRIPLGALTIVCGEPEVGKTTTVIDIMSRSSTGRPMPDGTHGADGMWFYMSSENDPWRTIKPRIVAAGGDVHEIRRIRATEIAGKTVEERAFELERDIAALSEAIDKGSTDEACIGVTLDPLNEYLGPNVNSWRDGDVLRVLGPLVDLAERHQVAVIGIMHPAKGEASTVLNKILGSKAFTMKARSVIFCVEDERGAEGTGGRPQYLMLNEKNSLAAKAPGLIYHFENVAPRADRGDDPAEIAKMEPVPVVRWHQGTVAVRMRDLAEDRRAGRSSGVADCMSWLVERLRQGGGDARTIEDEAKQMGFGPSTMRAARKKLGVISKKSGFGGGWQLELDIGGVDEDGHVKP